MAYDVILRKKNNRYIARVRNWPELMTEEDSREEALIQIREQLTEYLSQAPEIVQVDLESETNIDHPWLQFAGMWSDDETWDDFLDYAKFNSLGLAQVWNKLGGIFLQQERWVDARYYLDISVAAYHDLDKIDSEVEVLMDIIECELTRGNHSEALDQLNEIEAIISQHLQAQQVHYLTERLEEYRNELVQESVADSAEIGI